MTEYSSAEIRVMLSAFCKVYNLDKSQIENDTKILEWIREAPTTIVDYDRRIGIEDIKLSEERMELYEVYDGDISRLVDHLKRVFPDKKNLSKWELIINTCASILNPDELVKQASTREVVTNQHKVENPMVVEESLTIQDSSSMGSDTAEVDKPEDVIEEVASTTSEPEAFTDETNEVASTTKASTEETDKVDVATDEVKNFADDNIPVEETSEVDVPTEDVNEDVGCSLVEEAEKVSDVVNRGSEEEIAVANNQEHQMVDSMNAVEPSEVQEPPVANSEQTISVNASGTAKEVRSDSKSNKNHNIKEDTQMGDTNQLLNAINAAKPSDATKTATSNVAAVTPDAKDVLTKVAAEFGKDQAAKNEWTRKNVVTGIVSTMQPAALRVLSETGIATKKEGEEAVKDVQEKMEKFMCRVSGRNSITVEEFEALGDAAYDNVVVGETGKAAKAVAIAKETYKLYKQALNNPGVQLPIFVPAEDSLSYPTKGYVLGSTPMPTDEFIVAAMASNGVVYGEGHVNAEGKATSDKPVAFTLGIAKRKSANASKGIETRDTSVKVPVVRPRNKKAFLAEGNKIVYLFTQVVADAKATANFKALVKVDGEAYPANVSVWARENGNKVEKGKDKDGNTTYKKIQAGMNLSAEVQKINNKVFEAKFVADEAADIIVTAERWGISMTAEKQTGDFGNVKNFSQAPISQLFAAIYSGELQLSDTLKNAAIVQDIKAAANASAEAEAKESAEDLA